MATAHGATATEKAAPVTDVDRARSILSSYGVPVRDEENDGRSEDYFTGFKADFDDSCLYLYGHDTLTVVDTETGEDVAPELLNALRDVIADGGELVVRSTSRAKLRWISAYQYRVTPDAVYYRDLSHNERELEVSQE